MPPKGKSNATKKKGDTAEPTAWSSSPDPSAGNSSACTPEPRQRSQAGVPDTVSEKAAPVPTIPGHSQTKKGKPARWPGRVAKRGRAPANAPKDPAEQTSESPNSREEAGADVDGSRVTTEPVIRTTARRRLPARGPPAKRSSTSDGDATTGSAATAEQRPVKAGKRGRAAARQGAEPQALSTHGQHAAVDVPTAKRGRNTGTPVRPLWTHSKPAGALVEDGEGAGTAKSTEKEAAKRGRPAKSKAATTELQQKDHHELPADASNPGEGSESQNPLLPRKKLLGQLKQPVLVTSGGMDVSDVEAVNSLAKGTKRGRASGPIEAATSESQELGEQGLPAKCTMVSASSLYGKTSVTMAQGAKRAGRTAKQPASAAVPSTSSPETAAATDRNSGRVAKKVSAKAQPAAAEGPEKQEAKGQMATSNGTGKQKKVAKGGQQPKSKHVTWKDADDLGRSAGSAFIMTILLWVGWQLLSEYDDYNDFSTASIDSIIPPGGVLQPYRPNNGLIGARGSGLSSEDDMLVSPGDDLISRCKAKFGVGTLPHSTTTIAEAISMLVNFANSRRLPFGALAQLVTIVNKLFAPAKDVLPSGKALAKALSEMP
ncbi:hypothetical protein HPB50_027717 [Hyalomma asiaticum]|nr:hypothetical protein HPB50_027717 [Hyalomma asiaticum]